MNLTCDHLPHPLVHPSLRKCHIIAAEGDADPPVPTF